MIPRTTRRIVRAIVHSRQRAVCGEAEDGNSGVEKFQKLKPDDVLLDLSMPDINGIEAAKLMSAADPFVPLILFTILENCWNRKRSHALALGEPSA
jgi:chemotaxis response regulator CheB